MEVVSEIIPFFERDFRSKPLIDDKNWISKFSFVYPIPYEKGSAHVKAEESNTEICEKDADGDYVPKRRNKGQNFREINITLEHGVSSDLKLVGQQIWRGALLLADFIIYSMDIIQNQTVLELGAGVGLASIVAGMFAKEIICTDIDLGDILRLLRSNLDRNNEIIKSQITVSSLDFNKGWPLDINEKIKEVSIILAADVIYDNDVTEAFVETIKKILSFPPKKTLFLAMEKRYVFTISDLDTVAPCYEHLLTCLNEARRKEPCSSWKVEEIPLNFPQFFNYERIKELIMYKISSY